MNIVRNLLAILVVTAAAAHAAFAAHVVPEIDPSAGAAGLALLGGAIMVIRGRVRR